MSTSFEFRLRSWPFFVYMVGGLQKVVRTLLIPFRKTLLLDKNKCSTLALQKHKGNERVQMITEQDFNIIQRQSTMRVAEVSTELHRYLYNQINWSNRLICIRGARGVGKTTLLLQHIREQMGSSDKVLYVSLDNMWFQTHSLTDLADYFYTHTNTRSAPYYPKRKVRKALL